MRGDARRIIAVMPRVAFTPQLRRFTETPEVDSASLTLREALNDAFAANPTLRGYVLDDQGHLRANVVVFVDGRRSTDRVHLADPLRGDSRVYVLQALSGG
jgi:molybdopterin synthase sulfur carrier subunit